MNAMRPGNALIVPRIERWGAAERPHRHLEAFEKAGQSFGKAVIHLYS
jgi:hypothetical protein